MRLLVLFLILATSLFAHDGFCDRFSAHLEGCSCEHTTVLDNAMPLPEILDGMMVSQTIEARKDFNAISVDCIADVPEGATLTVEFSASNGNQWTQWQAFQTPQADIHFNDMYQAYRYRVTFQANEAGQLPQLHEMLVNYDYIFPHMMQSPQTLDISSVRNVVKPRVISRSEWKARSPKSGYSSHTPMRLTIHHTYRPLSSDFQGGATIRSIQNYHMDSNGWSDIGYHFIIGTYTSGTTEIYQGRPETVIGAHAGGSNTNNVGVNVVGDYDVEKVHPNSYKSLIHLLAWLCDRYRISPSNIFGHQDFNSTACPGQGLYKLIPQIKKDVSDFLMTAETERASTGTLMGVVYDSAKGTSSRLSGATVTLNNGAKAVSGSDGMFRFELTPGSYSYSVTKSGYKTGSTSRSVTANETTWGSVGLSSSGSSNKVLSGPDWVRQYPPSRSIQDLQEPFRSNMTRFYNALKSAGASVSISNTLRPPQRAHLMHYAYRIAKEGYNPRSVPEYPGVNIEWWHGSTSASVSAASRMVSAYGIVYRPALSSNHIRGEAIDMNVTWSGTLYIKNASGTTISVTTPRSGDSNRTLWDVGRTYGVLKLSSDPPHWSRNGN